MLWGGARYGRYLYTGFLRHINDCLYWWLGMGGIRTVDFTLYATRSLPYGAARSPQKCVSQLRLHGALVCQSSVGVVETDPHTM